MEKDVNIQGAESFARVKVRDGKMYAFFKRLFDIVFSVAGMILLSPIFLIASLAIFIEDGGAPIFTQTRIGKDGREFRMYKFRSMCVGAEDKLDEVRHLNEADGPVFKIWDDPRITKVGAILRKSSVDELPQLLNCFLGSMSLVGPRPPLPNEVEQYNDYQRQRLLVKPGITCYWQCSGRSDLNFDEWMRLDMKYIEERSLWTDFKVLLMTVPAVLHRKGAA